MHVRESVSEQKRTRATESGEREREVYTSTYIGCTLLQHPTSHALLTSPTPCERELVYGACIGTAQVGVSLVAPLDSLFKRSSLRSIHDILIVFVTCRNKLPFSTHLKRVHHPGTPPNPSCLYSSCRCTPKNPRLMYEHLPWLGYGGPTYCMLLPLCTPLHLYTSIDAGMLLSLCHLHCYIPTMAHPPRFSRSGIHNHCLPMLSCLSLARICGLGLCPFSVLVCDLLPLRRLFHGLPKAHCRRISQSQSWRAAYLMPFPPQWGGTIPWALRVMVFKEIDCENWLAREYLPAHQHSELLYPLAGDSQGLL